MADERRFIKNVPGGRGDLPFSRAVVARGFVWVSGVGGANQVTGEIGETIEEQTRGSDLTAALPCVIPVRPMRIVGYGDSCPSGRGSFYEFPIIMEFVQT